MTKFTSPLNNLKVASPCSQDWDAMIGNERKRYCGECKLNVYNLSGMSKAAAENLLDNADGRVCVRFYQRADGTVITQDCPVGWAKIKNRTKILATAAFSMVLSLFSGVLFASFFSKKLDMSAKPARTMGTLTFETNSRRQNEDQRFATMGNVAVTPKDNLVMGETNAAETKEKIIVGRKK